VIDYNISEMKVMNSALNGWELPFSIGCSRVNK
jgi:hypothetical protein